MPMTNAAAQDNHQSSARWQKLTALLLPAYFDRHERRLVLLAVIVGAAVWGVVTLLKLAVEELFALTMHWVAALPSPAFVLLPVVAGSVITAAIALWRSTYVYYRDKSGHVHPLNAVEGDGIEPTIALYYSSEPALDRALLGREGVRARWEMPTFSLALRKFAATLATLGLGASGGLEASVTLIGESVAVGLFKPWRRRPRSLLFYRLWRRWRIMNQDELQTIQLSGVAAAVATLVGAPLAGAFFATEIMYRRRPVVDKLIFALIAALTAFFLSHFSFAGHVKLVTTPFAPAPPLTWNYYLALVTLGVAASFLAGYFAQLRLRAPVWFARFLPNPWARHAGGAVLTVLVALAVVALTGESLNLILGTGSGQIRRALLGDITLQVALAALLGKTLATLATIGSGGSAGLLVPTIYLGAMLGVVVADLFGVMPVLLVAPGITAALVAVINVPLTAILLTVELFGANFLLPALVVMVVALFLAQHASVYRTQRERDDSRELAPGYGVRRIAVPPSWEGKTLAQLGLRARYDVNVIGFVETGVQGMRVLPHVPVHAPLHADNRLIVLGKNEALLALVNEVAGARMGTAAESGADGEAGEGIERG
jgi:CIC family chloride channel protein